jgi:hypothetical protein
MARMLSPRLLFRPWLATSEVSPRHGVFCNLALAKHIDHQHPALLAFLRESSLGGIDPSLWYRIDYMGVSNSRQPTTSKNEERGRAWRFEAMIDVAHHKGLIDASGDIFPDYFRLHILQGIADWETTIEP